jgi:hypothetical protein
VRSRSIIMFGYLIFATSISAYAEPPDLSSPSEALKSYLRISVKGGTLREYRDIVSEENVAIISALDEAAEGRVDLSEKIPPENRYAKLIIAKRQATDNRAIFQLRVKYKESWLQQEQKEVGIEDIPSDQRTGGEAISDASPGEEFDYPCHIEGDGYVSFLFLKQNGAWRFHKSYASSQPSDFSPLLKARDVSGGLTVTARKEPSPARPESVPDQPLAGRHSGKDWKGLFAYPSSFFSDDEHYGVDVLEKEEPDRFKQFHLRKLMVKIPKVPGEYKLSPMFNVTFFEPPGNNKSATDGTLNVKRNGAIYKVQLIAHFDKDNDVRGCFTFTPAAAGITEGLKNASKLKTTVKRTPQATVTKPKDDHTGDPCAVVRGKYEAALKRIDPSEPLSHDKARRILTLAGQYSKALRTLYGNLKKQGEIKDADRVKEENSRLRSSAEVVMAKAVVEKPETEEGKGAEQRDSPAPSSLAFGVTKGLVMHYTFDDVDGARVIDHSETKNDGHILGATIIADPKHPQAISFDGSDGYVLVRPFDGIPKDGDLSLCFWFKPEQQDGAWGTIVATEAFRIQSTGDLRIHWDWTAASARNIYTDPGVLSLKKWSHLALVRRADDLEFYVDGRQIKKQLGVPFEKAIDSLIVGMDGVSGIGGNDPLNGAIDEFRVYNRALAPSEVQRLRRE